MFRPLLVLGLLVALAAVAWMLIGEGHVPAPAAVTAPDTVGTSPTGHADLPVVPAAGETDAAWRARTDAELRDWETRVGGYLGYAGEATEDGVRAAWDRTRAAWSDLQAAGGETVDEARAGFDRAYDAFRREWERAEARDTVPARGAIPEPLPPQP